MYELHLPNDAFLRLEGKRKVVGNWILFKIIFGWGKWMKYVKVVSGQSSVDFSYRNPNLAILNF